jgi:peroxiredoxin
MKHFFSLLLALAVSTGAFSQYKVGDKIEDFSLKNIDEKMVSLADFSSDKGFIITFTCNHCPYSVLYEDRIIALDKKYKKKGYPVIAINPNDEEAYPSDDFAHMQKRAKEKGFTFPYLRDLSQDVAHAFGAKKTPHMYVVQKEGTDLVVKYIGAIDDNAQDASKVQKRYLENAVDELLAGKAVSKNFTRAIGCSIKYKKD